MSTTPNTNKSMTKQEAIEALAASDHCILPGDYARQIASAFGVSVKTAAMRDTRSQFKGAYFEGVKEGDVVDDVIDATILAEMICDYLDLEFRAFFGRGSQLRECVRVLRESIAC